MPVASVFTELSAMALPTGTRFVFPDSVAYNWSGWMCATWRVTLVPSGTEQSGAERKNATTTVHGSHVSFLFRAVGKIPARK